MFKNFWFFILISFCVNNSSFGDVQSTRIKVGELCKNHYEIMQMYDDVINLLNSYELVNKTRDNFDIEKLLEAIEFMAERHKGQTRKNAKKTPYVIHPLGVVKILLMEGKEYDQNTIIAALLHDLIEDTDTTKEEIENSFGPYILTLVEELTTPDLRSSYKKDQWQINHAPNMKYKSKVVKLADKIYNLRDVLKEPPYYWTAKRKILYFEWAEKLRDAIPSVNENLNNVLNRVLKRKNELFEASNKNEPEL